MESHRLYHAPATYTDIGAAGVGAICESGSRRSCRMRHQGKYYMRFLQNE